MGKQSDWVVHHLQCKMSAVCFRFHCALNLLVKIYSSISCTLFEDRIIAKPHLQGCMHKHTKKSRTMQMQCGQISSSRRRLSRRQ